MTAFRPPPRNVERQDDWIPRHRGSGDAPTRPRAVPSPRASPDTLPMIRQTTQEPPAVCRRPGPALSLLAAALLGCAGGGSDAAAAVRVPERAGTVWELDRAADRAAAPAALLAYANGLHVVVVDGDAVFAGMTRLPTERRDDGVLALTLPNGGRAELVSGGDSLALRFASGERIPLRQRAAATVAAR